MSKWTRYFLSYWHEWNQRERILVSSAGIILCIYLIYLLLYSPLQEAIIQARVATQENRATLDWMKHMQSRIKSLVPPQPVSTSELLSIIHDKLEKQAHLHTYPYQLTQASSGNIELKFPKVPFNLFLDWSFKLNQHYRFEIKQLNAQKTETSGVVQLTCLISVP